MLLLVFLIGFLASSPIGAQDENSEDAFEIRRDSSQENEGMDTFVMSTAILEQETTTAPSRPSTTVETLSVVSDETMGEDPFEPASSPILPDLEMTSPQTTVTKTTVEQTQGPVSTQESSEPTTETTAVENIVTTTETNVEVSTEVTSSSSTELEETIPTEADVWTTSTETAERRVLKEKSGEELSKKDPVEDTTATQVTVPHQDATDGKMESSVHIGDESTTKTSAEDEAPFDSSSLGGLFEADGSPKVEENSPAFPLASLPPHEQPEQSEEILEKERTGESTIETTTMGTTTAKKETTTTVLTTRKTEETTRPVMMRPAAMTKTPITIKITSIDWMNDFADKSSGKFRKLSDQILPELTSLLKNELGDDFVSVQIESFTKGSVVVNAVIDSREPVGDPEQLATRLESTISAAGSQLAGNTVDTASITVNGIPSRAYLEKVNQAYAPSNTSPLLIAAIIGVATVLLILVVILICLVNNRRSHGGMKMGLPTVEDAPPRAFGVPQLNSMSYASSTRNTGIQPRPDEREVV